MPSNFERTNAAPGSVTASAKEAFLRVSDPTLILSCEMKPDIEPDPYLIAKGVPSRTKVSDLSLA